ncbi:MAG: gamma-glutamyltranspeptidase [Ilumatobacter sp.]|nr:MAG: gamma-glutamyltranspeptidase [Ilumatobacter sp.]
MPSTPFPFGSTRGVRGCVATADQLASQAGLVALRAGGNAIDAAIAANAAMTVTGPHLCGLGGDLFALVHTGRSVVALNASGRAGSGVDADELRREGHAEMPFRHDVRTVTVPGCVDGWVTLHERFGALPMADVLAPAIELAELGFPASPLLVGSLAALDAAGRANLRELAEQATRPGAVVVRSGVGRALRAVAEGGRDAFYGGEFGSGLLEVGCGAFSPDDLAAPQSDWVEPLAVTAFGVELTTIGPNSQGYLTLGAAALATHLDLPDDPDDPQWAHLLIEAATAAGYDRPDALHEHADGVALLAEIATRAGSIDPRRATRRAVPTNSGDTTYLCTADAHGMAVSLIQSNASGFGSWLVEPSTGINLHNRGLGFNLVPGHAAELGPGRRPPHTLAPALATHDGHLVAVFGTMGGDAQPQILLQIATRLFRHRTSPARAVEAARWALEGPTSGFDTWTGVDGPLVAVEEHAPEAWVSGLIERGHRVITRTAYDSAFGHAHAIAVEHDGVLVGAADPRTRVGSAAAF